MIVNILDNFGGGRNGFADTFQQIDRLMVTEIQGNTGFCQAALAGAKLFNHFTRFTPLFKDFIDVCKHGKDMGKMTLTAKYKEQWKILYPAILKKAAIFDEKKVLDSFERTFLNNNIVKKFIRRAIGFDIHEFMKHVTKDLFEEKEQKCVEHIVPFLEKVGDEYIELLFGKDAPNDQSIAELKYDAEKFFTCDDPFAHTKQYHHDDKCWPKKWKN